MASKGPRRATKSAAPAAASPEAKLAVPFVNAEAAEPVSASVLEDALAALPDPAPVAVSPAAIETPAEPQAPAAIIEAAEAAVTPAVETTAATATEEVKTMATQFETTTANPAAVLGEFNERSKVAVEKSTKIVEEMTDFAKGNVEAMVEASRIAAKGMETLGQEAAEYSRKSFESATAAMKSFAGVKSPTEFFKLQSDFMRQSFDQAVAETSKNTETMLKLAGDAAQPLSNRFAVAAEKVKTAA
jgi:phasin family protein